MKATLIIAVLMMALNLNAQSMITYKFQKVDNVNVF